MTEYQGNIEGQGLSEIVARILQLQAVPDSLKEELAEDLREELDALAAGGQIIAATIEARRDDIAARQQEVDQLQDQINELRDQIADRRRQVDQLRADIARLQDEAAGAEADADRMREQLDLLQGKPSTEAYNVAFERIKSGERPRVVRAEFQRHFDVTPGAFRRAMHRRRQWEAEAQ